MTSAFKFWQQLLSRKQTNKGRIKWQRLPLDFETLENRYGPTPGIELGLSVMGFAFANPLGIGASTTPEQVSVADSFVPEQSASAQESLAPAVESAPPDRSPTPNSGQNVGEGTSSSEAVSAPKASKDDFIHRPYDDFADTDQLLFQPSRPSAPGGAPAPFKPIAGDGGGDASSGRAGTPPNSGSYGPLGFDPPKFQPGASASPPNNSTTQAPPNATGLPQAGSGKTSSSAVPVAQTSPAAVSVVNSSNSTSGSTSLSSGTGGTSSSSSGSGASAHLRPTLGVSSGDYSLYVLDDNNGLVLTPNVVQNDFSTYAVQLDANVIRDSLGSTSISYSWDLSGASDATSASGTSSYRVNFTWGSFSGASRTDTVGVSITDGTQVVSESIVFKVASTTSPGYSATQPTTSGSWLSLLPPDAVTASQAMGGTGPYYQVGLTDGELQLTHTLPAYNPNVPALQLMFVSTAAKPQPIFDAHYQISPTDTTPGTINAQLTFNGTAGTSASLDASLTFSGDTLQIGLQAGATSLSTGRYPYTFQVTDANATTVTTTYSGSVDIVNYGSNAFGGWSLAGVERVYSVTGGVLLDLGDGQSLWFANGGVGGTFVTPAGDFSTLTQNTATGVYTRTMPDGTKYNFNSSGYQTAVVDRNSNATTYLYDGSNHLTSIKDFNNQLVTLSYSGSNVTSIADPAGRTATLAYNSSGILTSIKDPNATLWTYAYDSASKLTQLNDPRNAATTFTYGLSNRITGVERADTSAETFTPIQLQGLIGGISPPGHATNTLLLAQAPEVTTDADSNVSNVFIDWTGFGNQPESIDALGDTSIGHQTTAGLDWLSADALGNASRAFFDSNGNVTKMVQATGAATQYTYNGFNEVSQTTDGLGNLSTASYDANGNMTQTKDTLGNLTTYTYTSQGLVSTTKDPRGDVTTYSYNGQNELTQTKDALGNLTTSLYDSAGNLVTSIDALGNRTTYSFDLLGRQTQVQDALGNLTTSLFDSSNHLTTSIDARGDRTTYSFDGNGRQTQVQDALGNLTTSLFDAAGNLTTSIDSRGNRTTYSYDGSNRQTQVQDALSDLTTTLYDSANNLTTSIDARGDRTTYSFDANNRQTTVKDALGNLSTSVYDAAGNLTTSIDARGNQTTYSFDASERQTQVTDSLGNLTTSVFDTAGNMTTSIDALGHRTTYSFDQLNRQTQMQDVTGSLSTSIFDQAGNLTTQIDARNHRTTYSFDALNRQTQMQDALSNLTTCVFDQAGNLTTSIDGLSKRTTYAYDVLNRQTSIKDANSHVVTTVFDVAGNVTTSIDASGARTTYAFDPLNRQTSAKDPGLGVATTVYDQASNVTNTIDQMGEKTTYVFDGLNRQTTIIDARGGYTTTVFDANRNTINVIDPVGNKTTFAFDAMNRQTWMTDPLGHTGTIAYDAAGRETSATDRDGRLISYSYDNLNRETGETWVVSGSTVNTFTFTFDGAGDILTAANSAGTYTMAYDNLNRPTGVQEPFGLSLTYAYDAAGHKTTTQDSFGGTLTSVYDPVGLLTTREFGGTSQTPVREDLTYNARNQIATKIGYSNLAGTTVAVSTANSYDAMGRITNIQNFGNLGGVLTNYTYTYDLASRLSSEKDDGTNTSYTYDATSQLTAAGAMAYSYDLNGNRTMAGYSTGTDNQLLNDGTWTYSYDAEGNMTKKSKGTSAETWFFTYDNKNHMIGTKQEATDGGTLKSQATYVYDALGNRTEEDVWVSGSGLVATRFGYNGQNVWVDLNASNQLQMRHFYLNGLDQIYARVDSSGSAAWYLTDHLGSIREVINSPNTTTDVITYDAFGSITSETNDGFGDRYKYTGREFDSLLGLQFNRARNYSPTDGLWIEQDPLGFKAGDTNLYRYVSNRPVDGTDPSGMRYNNQGMRAVNTQQIELGEAGFFAWGIRWVLPDAIAKDKAHNTGVILQIIKTSYEVYTWDGRRDQDTIIIAESWTVNNGLITPTKTKTVNGYKFTNVNDIWDHLPDAEGTIESGTLDTTGEASFYEKMSNTDLTDVLKMNPAPKNDDRYLADHSENLSAPFAKEAFDLSLNKLIKDKGLVVWACPIRAIHVVWSHNRGMDGVPSIITEGESDS